MEESVFSEEFAMIYLIHTKYHEKNDTNFGLLNTGNRSEKVSKNIKFRYLYRVIYGNHGIYVWNRFHFERVEKALSR